MPDLSWLLGYPFSGGDLFGPVSNGVTISCTIARDNTRVDRPCNDRCTSIANLARSVGVVQSAAASSSG